MSTRLHLAAAVAVLVPACGDNESPDVVVIDGETAAAAVDAGHARGTNVAAQALVELSASDYQMVIGKSAGIIDAIHTGEVDTALFAVQHISADDVFRFANDMIVEHEDAHAQLDTIVRAYGVPYLPSEAQVQLTHDAAAALSGLRDAEPNDFDFAYTELQITLHAEAQVVLAQLADFVGGGAMGDYVAEARVMVDEHLARATTLLSTFYR